MPSGTKEMFEGVTDEIHRRHSSQTRFTLCRFFERQRTGVCLAHLKQEGLVDHAVRIDCEHQLTWDRGEEWSVSLIVDSLVICGVDDSLDFRIKDSRNIVANRA